MNVDITFSVWCESIKPGATFVARYTDGKTGTFYSGSSSDPWPFAAAFEAFLWALEDYVCRVMLGLPHAISQRADARPGDRFSETPPRTRRITPGPIVVGDLAASGSAGCVGGSIPMSSAPRLFGEATASPAPTKRRARR